MAFDNFRLIFPRSDFKALMGPIPHELLTAKLISLPLASPIIDIRVLPANGISVEWESLISPEDRRLVSEAIASFEAHATTSEPFAITNDGPVLGPSSSPVTVISFSTPPLDAGTYQVLWLCQHRLTLPASNTSSRAIATVEDVTQVDSHHHDTPRAFNGSLTFQRKAGEKLRVELAIAKNGIGAVSAEMTSARFILDRLS